MGNEKNNEINGTLNVCIFKDDSSNEFIKPTTFLYPASSYIASFDIVKDDLKFNKIEEFPKRELLLFLCEKRYDKFTRQLPFPRKRLIDVPREKILHWNNYPVQVNRDQYTSSWRKSCRIPPNLYGPI